MIVLGSDRTSGSIFTPWNRCSPNFQSAVALVANVLSWLWLMSLARGCASSLQAFDHLAQQLCRISVHQVVDVWAVALRRELGDEAFWSGLKLFTQTHAGGVVESRDAQIAFENASGRDLTALFDEWVF